MTSVNPHDWEHTVVMTAGTTVTVGDLFVNTGNKAVSAALTSATSGNTYTAKFFGRVSGVTKTTSTDTWNATDDLTVVSGGTVAKATSSSVVNAVAYSNSVSTDGTADILLFPPKRSGL